MDNRWEKLKIAASQFYLNQYQDLPTISDEEYDTLAKEYESETGNSVKTLVDWPEQLVLENEPEEPLNKEIVRDNDLNAALERVIEEVGECYATLKYDGGAIKMIYNDHGQLIRIQSTPDEKLGIVRTEQFWDLVPHQIPVELGIKCIRGEVLVDAEKYGKLARNKANGLINSTVNQEEINDEAYIRWYKLTFFDGEWNLERSIDAELKIPQVWRERDLSGSSVLVPVFAPAEHLTEAPENAIVDEGFQTNQKVKFQCDGIVIYSNKGIRGEKFYFTDSAITTVTDVIWNQQSNGSYAAVLALDPVTLDDKYIQKVTSGGVKNLMGLSDNSPGAMGVGAKVRVILANTTIPKVVEVLEESTKFNFPICKCGYKMTENDCYGNVLKCGNTKVCIDKVLKWMPEVIEWILEEKSWGDVKSVRNAITRLPQWFGYVFHIDRWDPFVQSKLTEKEYLAGVEQYSESLMRAEFGITDEYIEDMKKWCDELYNFSELQWANLEINLASGLEVIRRLIKLDTFENIKKYLDEIRN